MQCVRIQVLLQMSRRTYSELIKLQTLEERFKYLCLSQIVGETTFGSSRYVNQSFYNSREWRNIRRFVILRDESCDLAIPDRTIFSGIRIHHMNPLSLEELHKEDYSNLLDPECLICTSLETHNALHYGNFHGITNIFQERIKGDTTPWKKY